MSEPSAIAASARKDALDIAKDVSVIVSTVAVPVVLAILGNNYNRHIAESANKVHYVELAIAQLRAAPTPETAELRAWAVALLDKEAPIKLSEQARSQLNGHALAAGATLTGEASMKNGGAQPR